MSLLQTADFTLTALRADDRTKGSRDRGLGVTPTRQRAKRRVEEKQEEMVVGGGHMRGKKSLKRVIEREGWQSIYKEPKYERAEGVPAITTSWRH